MNYNQLKELYSKTINSFKDENVYKNFLARSSYNYKIPFSEQALVFAQKQKAVAIAPFNVWNKTFKRSVKSGTSGIAVFDRNNANKVLYYYDISDTNVTENSIEVPLWEYQNTYENKIVKSLNNSFNITSDDIETAVKIVADTLVSNNTALGMLISGSTALSVLGRLNLTADIDLSHVSSLNAREIIEMGNEVNKNIKLVLGAISKEIQNIKESVNVVEEKAAIPIIDEQLSLFNNEKPLIKPKEPIEPIEPTYSPFYQKYTIIKNDYPNHLVLTRLGDFFEAYNADSEIIAQELDFTLMSRIVSNNDDRFNMIGMPEHSLMQNVEKLRKNGHDVAVLDNDEITEYSKIAEINKEIKNYVITENELGLGTPSVKFTNNIKAIESLKLLQAEDRLATAEEQNVLANYVGFGGLDNYFNESHAQYNTLKNLLSEEDYEKAQESMLTAFYTSPEIIKSMYTVLENMGFESGNILEPSCGTGNFIGLLPENMQESTVYGVELDNITGQIAKALYPKSKIQINAYENTNFDDNFFDVAIGNVPFGEFSVNDSRYNKNKWLIHDYFFGATLDKIRSGGVIAFITSKGTLDKQNPAVRKYLCERATLLGAIRLPQNAFKANAGTQVTSDIIFLQKREQITTEMEDWVNIGTDENGLEINQYYVNNPHMIMGEMQEVSSRYGMKTACVLQSGDLPILLKNAVKNIAGTYEKGVVNEDNENNNITIPATADVRNYSYTIVNGDIYYRENSIMEKVDCTNVQKSRITGLIRIRDCLRNVIEYQTQDYSEDFIIKEQEKLNLLYDEFRIKHNLISKRGNKQVFLKDVSYPLLCSLENLDDKGNLKSKADIFTKRTIKAKNLPVFVETSREALALSLAEKAKIDIEYMSELTRFSEEKIYEDLTGVIYLNPLHENDEFQEKYLPADEYLSGNVREKLKTVELIKEISENDYSINYESLLSAQPEDLKASDIEVRLGVNWITTQDYRNFLLETLETSSYYKDYINVEFSPYTVTYNITGKNIEYNNIKVNTTFGTKRANAYSIIEDTLNQRNVTVYDPHEDYDGKIKYVVNEEETKNARIKQNILKTEFKNWVWKDEERRNRLVKYYNEHFNAIKPREYNGSHLNFIGMNTEITLKEHQKNAVARTLYGGNTLLAHVVGAGKTFTMVASAMESKRLGLCNKSLIVVPNHIVEQFSNEFMQLYPSANVLFSTKNDFTPLNRKKFCSRIATGDYDAVIISHSQFGMIPISQERQVKQLKEQLNEITKGIEEISKNNGAKFSQKQLQKTKKDLAVKLQKVTDQPHQDNVITFEELGVDRLYVDEAHLFKNLYTVTKMTNVSGIGTTDAQKTSDLFAKTRYLDELTGGKGVVFATGTPISNTISEMYTLQRYLQYDRLKEQGLTHFDAWATNFAETVVASELAPEGTGFRQKTSLAKFVNLPELIYMYKEVADVQTEDMLNLPVPKANYHVISSEASLMQRSIIQKLGERADDVRDGKVKSFEDNLLNITTDGRKLGLDQRVLDPLLPDVKGSKVNKCVDNIYNIWNDTKEKKLTQIVFCDLSTPKKDGSFSVYNDMKDKLIAQGIPEKEIAFIHDYKTDGAKTKLFQDFNEGKIRVLFGSTSTCGAGTNAQKKLVALHDLDCPWRPSDLAQRSGRIVRQGNENKEVDIFRYVTKGTFDSYLWQTVEKKQKFISQVMTSKNPSRTIEDIDATALSMGEIKALTVTDPLIAERLTLTLDLSILEASKKMHYTNIYELQDKISKSFPKDIQYLTERIDNLNIDIETAKTNPKSTDKNIKMTINNKLYTDKKSAGTAMLLFKKGIKERGIQDMGEYRGFKLQMYYDKFSRQHSIVIKGKNPYSIAISDDVYGNITRLDNVIASLDNKLKTNENELENDIKQLENAKIEVLKPFENEDILKEKTDRLAEVNAILSATTSKGTAEMNDNKQECINFIDEKIRENYDGFRLSKDTARQIMDNFTNDTISIVLAHKIRSVNFDRRLSEENKDWANAIIGNSNYFDNEIDYDIFSDVGIVNSVTNQFRKELEIEFEKKVDEETPELFAQEVENEFYINEKSDNIEVAGYEGTWYVIESEEYNKEEYFLLEHEEYGDETASLIVDKNRKIVLEDVWNGFSDLDENIEILEKNALPVANTIEDDKENNRFFINEDGSFTWIYKGKNEDVNVNEDGSFSWVIKDDRDVFMKYNFIVDDVKDIANAKNDEEFFQKLDENSECFMLEATNEEYENTKNQYYSGKLFCENLDENAMKKLKDVSFKNIIKINDDMEI